MVDGRGHTVNFFKPLKITDSSFEITLDEIKTLWKDLCYLFNYNTPHSYKHPRLILDTPIFVEVKNMVFFY